MARRQITIDGETWTVYPSGRITFYNRDEVALVFELGTGANAVQRVVRVRPLGAQRRDLVLKELSDAQLERLFEQSQRSRTSPEAGYRRRKRSA